MTNGELRIITRGKSEPWSSQLRPKPPDPDPKAARFGEIFFLTTRSLEIVLTLIECVHSEKSAAPGDWGGGGWD